MIKRGLLNQVDREILETIRDESKPTCAKVFKKSEASLVPINQHINQLISKGIIKREVNPKNQREKILSYCYPKLKINDFIELLKE